MITWSNRHRFARTLAFASVVIALGGCAAINETGDAARTDARDGQSDGASDIVHTDGTNDGPASDSSSACTALSTCSACAGNAGCGWCLTTSRCLAGNSAGSTDGTCTGPSWDFTGDLCTSPTTDAGTTDTGTRSDGGCIPTVARGGEDTNALCSNGIDDDCNGYIDCNDYNCSRNPAVTVCGDAGVFHDAGCVPTVPRGGEDTNALCSNGIDDDCNGYIDCNDWNCSRNSAVTVCRDGGVVTDSGTTDSGVPIVDSGPIDAGPAGPIGPTGGTVGLMHFAVFGDVRPPSDNDTSGYPSTVIGEIMTNLRDVGAQFAAAQGDYMFASDTTDVGAQISMLLSGESMYGGYIFHGMGNHECTGATASNCPNANETPNVLGYMSQLNVGHGTPYFDWVIHTSLGDAHFISTAPNAWSTAQQSWLSTVLAQPATYIFVLAHEPPTGTQGPGSGTIDSMVSATPGVTFRFYGHTHEYRHITANEVINGNAGAPLSGTGSGDYYGFAIVDQRADGNIVFTSYQVGTPPMVMDSFVVTPAGAPTI